MAHIKHSIEKGFKLLAHFIFRFRWVFIFFMIFLTIAAVSQLKKLTIDMSDESFLHKNDPILTTYLDFRDQFGRDDLIVLAIKGENIFRQDFLRKLAKLHNLLEEDLDHVDEIFSMVNARNTYGVTNGIVVEDLLEQWPETDKDLLELRNRVMANPLYRDRLISEDGSFTTILVRLDAFEGAKSQDDELLAGFAEEGGLVSGGEVRHYLSEEEKSKIVQEIQKIAAPFYSDDFQIHIAGSPVIVNTVKKNIREDMVLFLRLAILTIGVCLFLMFRRFSAVVLPLVVVILSLISTLAVMAITGVPIKLPTMILPSFLLAVGVGDSVHILSLFFQHFNQHGKKEDALVYTLGHSGLAVLMTSLTTAGGLLSFVTAKIAPVFDLGLFASLGVLLALIYSVVFLPAMLAVVPLKPKKGSADQELNPKSLMMGRIMDWLTSFSTGHAKKIVVVSVLILIISGIGLSKMRFSHDILSWLPATTPVQQATRTIDKELKGSVTLELILDTGRENGLYDPKILNKIETLARDLESDKGLPFKVGKVMAVTDILKEIHLALNENRPEFYVIPQDEKLIPQEFLLFENSGSDDLEDVIDSRFQLARITIKVPWQDAMNYVPFIGEVESRAADLFASDATVTITGIMALFGRIIYASIYSAATSYMIAGVVITLMMMCLIGSIRLGLVSMVPNLTPILITMGLMGWFGISLNMFTMLIGSIAIGLAVDDTIHFVYNFQRYFGIYGEPVEAVRQTLRTAGRAMLTTTVVLSLGFFIFMFASMQNLFHFGLLTGSALILALIADFFLAPALLTLVAGSKAGRRALSRK